ncbi:uncharacterized protein LOC115757284 isoform X2 [Rhodamnia argentea]|uniref:Uncharacterized protein LOC115757284 isoform X2 n=1 Tax=Rhodamnia argentea TaxID=178133 RepID=A0ABM3HWU0_9MYRT|nr:uncharacterized protein LOC115757284 isoform X2 [Rhodamnia argentea]
MEYERIEKVQTGMISPSKLRMKLMGPHHHRKKDGSNSNSSRTSPSKVEEPDFAKNSLLASNGAEFDEEATRVETTLVKAPVQSSVSERGHFNQASLNFRAAVVRENENVGRARIEQFAKGDGSNSSAVYPMRILEDENLDYDSNASSSSFEFHKGEKSVHHHVNRSLSRSMPSKWNDAEKWIMNRQSGQANYWKKSVLQNQTNRLPVMNTIRVAPEHAGCESKLLFARGSDTKRVDFGHPTHQMGVDKFSFGPSGGMPTSGQSNDGNLRVDANSQTKDLMEVVHADSSCIESSTEESTGVPTMREVSMRDMGTEMTPATSQEPSRTATPVGSATPLRSPTSSVPSTPRRGAPAPTPAGNTTDEESQHPIELRRKELSEEEMKLKTRREIVALGVQLGKMNIAAWASKEESEKNKSSSEKATLVELERIEFEKRAAAWEEAEKSKHTARYKREEIKLQAWESQQKAKLEAEMRRIEAQVEQMRAQAQAKMVKKIAMARQRSEEKRAAAEARRNCEAEKTAAQAEHIRQTGRMPSSPHICCGGWL